MTNAGRKLNGQRPDPEWAWSTVREFVQDDGLRRHMLAVGAAMERYARQLDQDSDYWRAVGILHDFDWEIHPDLDEHPIKGAEILRERGVDEETIRVILSHYTAGTGVEREKPIDYALFACDDITGLITAVTLVRPSKDIADVKLKSVRKKWKDRRFAAGVDREHVEEAVADFSRACFDGQLDLWRHVQNVLQAMQGEAEALALDGQLAAS
ncbi:MAG TPA: HDIG domain-containing protein [Candidatus Sulfomarinibacteraceae bacterium]|nr:HDIG domain-containing protein [Candidatus Sulfomarinibacteraceae bacterium]